MELRNSRSLGMAFFVGDLVVSVSGCSLDERIGLMSLADPCVELTIGNSLHSTDLPIETEDGKSCTPEEMTEACMTFHGVTEKDVLTVTVLDRAASSSKNCQEGFLVDAKPLPCARWGVGFGSRAALRTCVLAVPKAVTGSKGSSAIGAEAKAVLGEVFTVQLSIRWAPEMRLRKPLSLVAVAGGWTRRLLSCKIDRPIAVTLNLALNLAEQVATILESSRWKPWKSAALVASVAGFSLASAWLLALSVFFLPITMVIVAMLSLMAPPVLVVMWVLACTTPACEQLWRPLLVWTGTRAGLVRKFLLLPVAENLEGAYADGCLMREKAISREGLRGDPDDAGQGSTLPASRLQGDHGAVVGHEVRGEGGGEADVGAVLLLLACCQNMISVLSSGLEASRWKPLPRENARR